MKKHVHFGYGLALMGFSVLMIISCSGIKILSTDTTPGFSLSNYKTFDYFEMEIDPAVQPEYVERVSWMKDEISRYLQGRGLSQSSENADMLINIGMLIEEKIQTRETTIRDAPVYMGQRGYSWQSSEVEVGRYDEGTVTVDLVDRQKDALMWQGVAQSVMAKKEASSKKNIAAGVQQLFAELP